MPKRLHKIAARVRVGYGTAGGNGCMITTDGVVATREDGTRTAPAGRYTGRRLARPDAGPLLRGLDHYVADIRPPGCLDVAFTRSYLAHGELRGVDVRPAL